MSQSEAQEKMDSLPYRVNDLERANTLTDHRLRVLEEEKLPHRVGNLETTASQMASDMHDVKSTISQIGINQTSGFEEFRVALAKIESSTKTRSSIVVTLLAVLTIIIGAIGLVPKFDAGVVEKTPQKATIKE